MPVAVISTCAAGAPFVAPFQTLKSQKHARVCNATPSLPILGASNKGWQVAAGAPKKGKRQQGKRPQFRRWLAAERPYRFVKVASQSTSSTSPDQLVLSEGQQSSTAEASSDEELEKKCLKAALDLQEHGWAVVEGVLSQADCDEYIQGLWDFLEGLGTGIDRRDESTWGPDHFPPCYRGILNTLEVGHHAFVWKVRKNPRLLKVFERLWGTNELLSSFDAINMLGPHNEAPSAGWLHVDQKPTTPEFACIQGIVNLTEVGPDITGTLMVKDKSYKVHQEFFYRASNLSPEQLNRIPDHYQFTPEQLPFWDRFESIGLRGGPGSVFLWDSRTVHSNTAPAVLKQWRHVVYCCYQPRAMASERDLDLKAKAWQDKQLTTHLPAADIRIYDEDFAKLYPNEAKVMNAENVPSFKVNCDRYKVEDHTVRRLAGVEPYPEGMIRTATPLMQVPVEDLKAQLPK